MNRYKIVAKTEPLTTCDVLRYLIYKKYFGFLWLKYSENNYSKFSDAEEHLKKLEQYK